MPREWHSMANVGNAATQNDVSQRARHLETNGKKG